jgi:signal peptide peptidase SppA
MDQISAVAAAVAKGESVSASLLPKSAASTFMPAGRGGYTQNGSVAVVSCHGVALYSDEFQPYCFSTRQLAQVVNRLAADNSVSTIILDIDSPGGAVTGTKEAGDAVFAARSKKSVIALVNPLAASAAYWIASQATTIIAVPSADVGSIGVFMLHVDLSQALKAAGVKPTYIFAGRYKVEGNAYQPLADSAKAYLQAEVDDVYSDFVGVVARGRRTAMATVKTQFGQGRTMSANAAKLAGMVDRIEAPDAAVSRIIGASGGNRSLDSVMGAAIIESKRMDDARRRMRILRH